VGQENFAEPKTVLLESLEGLREVALRIDDCCFSRIPIQDEIDEIAEVSNLHLREGFAGEQALGFILREVGGQAGFVQRILHRVIIAVEKEPSQSLLIVRAPGRNTPELVCVLSCGG
jgi:hypothetical protein